eukprot:TRINITY_DN13675_c0_g1_i1.p1 TRINITY_DN13675_c0_g1~~TRINITY_DN13675_c0_g1_i1.p1  ORF type:complete len:292 (+),score=42.87 TRINITY_DN13675_c0_g1_i1:225-1100(+)
MLKKTPIEDYELQSYSFGGHTVKCYAEKEDEFGFPSKSTGTTVWPSALLLCKYLVAHQDLVKDKTVIELGCGTALPGLFCAQLASKIALTDKSKRILASCKRSVAANAIPDSRLCLVDRLTFGNQSECNSIVSKLGSSSEIDLIIASDVLYAASAIEAFWATVCQLCDAGARRPQPSVASSDAPEAPAPPNDSDSSQNIFYPTLIMSFVSRDEAQDEAMLYTARINRFDYEQISFDSFITDPKDIPSSNFVRPETMRLYKFTRRPPPMNSNPAISEFQAQLASRRVAHLCT